VDGSDNWWSGAVDREISALLRRLGPRRLLVRNVHSTPYMVLLQPRWALSFMRGPMTLGDIRQAIARGRLRVVA